MTEIIDRDRAVELLGKVLPVKGADYVYRAPETTGTCVYFGDDGEPSCIVGHVFAELGVAAGQVHGFGYELGMENDPGNSVAIRMVRVEGVELTEGARSVLAAAQNAQDSGRTWGDAVDVALDRAKTSGLVF